ncbi:hypothetical protein GW781_14785, partial [bacterium]|nr:hypothetical protein [bacterium]
GHFLNWIDTRTLATLPPAYVSTVDSGNLAGSLIALKQGCLAMAQQSVWRWEAWQGLMDLLLLLAESLPAQDDPDLSATRLRAHLDQIREQVLAVGEDPAQWQPLLAQLLHTVQPAINQQLVDLLAANA